MSFAEVPHPIYLVIELLSHMPSQFPLGQLYLPGWLAEKAVLSTQLFMSLVLITWKMLLSHLPKSIKSDETSPRVYSGRSVKW